MPNFAIKMVSRPSRPSQTERQRAMYDTVHISRTLRPGETVAADLAEAQSIREHEFTAAHLARRRPASGTAYYGAASNPALVGVGEANNLAQLTIAEERLGPRLSPWPLEGILAGAAIAEALLAMEVPPGDVPHGHAIGVPVHATSTVVGPVMGVPVSPMTGSWANPRAYYDAYYNRTLITANAPSTTSRQQQIKRTTTARAWRTWPRFEPLWPHDSTSSLISLISRPRLAGRTRWASSTQPTTVWRGEHG